MTRDASPIMRRVRERWRHTTEIRDRYGFRAFSEPLIQWRLSRWLYALCWTGTDRPSVLFDRATAWLIAAKVLLPGASVLERLVAQIRTRANRRLWRRLNACVTPDQRSRLESLLTVSEGDRQSPLDRLRSGPTLQSIPELGRAIARLEEIRKLASGLPRTDRLTKTKVLALARFAGTARAQAVARFPDERRIATLLAFIQTLEASAQDDVLDLFDIIVTRMFAEAEKTRKEKRLRGLRDLDGAALTLRKACTVLLNENLADAMLRQTVFSTVPRSLLEEAIAKVDDLARSPDDPYFDEIVALYGRVQRFLPHMARAVEFGALPAGRAVIEAIHHLRALERGNKARAAYPVEFVPKPWMARVKKGESVEHQAWTLCLLERMRVALRKREIFVTPSLRYADPRLGLLDGAAWEAARPAVCRSLGLPQSAAEAIARLSAQIDAAYRRVAADLPKNSYVRFEPSGEMVLTGLDKLDEPDSLVALREAVEARLPRVELPELLLEMQARTGFADEFMHVSEAGARADDLPISVCGVLVGEACNTGPEPLIRTDIPALRRHRLSWVHLNYFRAETITKANARFVAAQAGIALAQRWGGGEVRFSRRDAFRRTRQDDPCRA